MDESSDSSCVILEVGADLGASSGCLAAVGFEARGLGGLEETEDVVEPTV